MKIITEQKGKLKGKKVLLRLDLNAPIADGKLLDNFKVEKVLATLGFLKGEGAKTVILSHIGRSGLDSLAPVCEYLRKFFETSFVKDIFDDNANKIISKMQTGDIVMLENLRQYTGEKNNDLKLAKKLASLGDIYVNNAFGVSHRNHCSIVGLPKLMESYCGLLFAEEIKELKQVSQADRPRLFVLGGNKLKTKLPLVKKILEMADSVFIGGALANDFFKAQGFEMGRSLVSDKNFNLSNLVNSPKIILPVDVIAESSRGVVMKKPNEILEDERIVDVGLNTIERLRKEIAHSKFVLWNGPLGDYLNGFSDATFELVRIIADSNISSVAGGGDTEYCISKLGLEEKFDFISTGGGAMLEFVATGTLPGIEALQNKI